MATEERLPIGHELTEGTPHHALAVYGTDTCEDTQRSRALLDSLGVQYNYYDVEKDAAMARTSSALQNGGQKTPVIDFGEGLALVEPSDEVLTRSLRERDRIPHTLGTTP